MNHLPRIFLLLYCCIIVIASISLLHQLDLAYWWRPAIAETSATSAGDEFIRPFSGTHKCVPYRFQYNAQEIAIAMANLTPEQLQEAYLHYRQLLVSTRQELAAELRAFDMGHGCKERVRGLIAEVEWLMGVVDGLIVYIH